MTNELLKRIRKTSTINETAMLSKSILFEDKDMITLPIPALNIACSGDIDGGFTPGLTMWAGPSKNFKSLFALLMAKAYMDKYPEAIMLFYDSEFGTPKSYWTMMGIDTDRVIHSPLTDIEVLKFDIITQLNEIKRGDKIIIVIDSIGNLASKREVDNAINQKSVEDMTRAKQIKSLFRMVTPHLTLKDIPLVVVNHTYKEIGLYPKDIVGGGTGSYYSGDNIFIVGRQQNKDGTELLGYNFVVNIEKSRYVQEKSKIPITVSFDKGISKWSGLLEIALETGHVIKPKNGWYAIATDPEKSYREAATDTEAFWTPIIADESFKQAVKDKFQLGHKQMISEEEGAEYDEKISEVFAEEDE